MQKNRTFFGALFCAPLLLLSVSLSGQSSLPGSSVGTSVVLTAAQYRELTALLAEYKDIATQLRTERDALKTELNELKAPLQKLPEALSESKTGLTEVQSSLTGLTYSIVDLKTFWQQSKAEIEARETERNISLIGNAVQLLAFVGFALFHQ